MKKQSKSISIVSNLNQKVMDYGLLVKFKLSIWVVFSATLAYLTASSGKINWAEVMLLSIGGFLVTGAANALNQVLERDYDKLMPRTANRPVATGRMSVSEAVLAAGLMLLFGMVALCTFNALTGFLGMLSFVTYAFIYTPLKRSTPFAVAVSRCVRSLQTSSRAMFTAVSQTQIAKNLSKKWPHSRVLMRLLRPVRAWPPCSRR